MSLLNNGKNQLADVFNKITLKFKFQESYILKTAKLHGHCFCTSQQRKNRSLTDVTCIALTSHVNSGQTKNVISITDQRVNPVLTLLAFGIMHARKVMEKQL